MVGLGLRLAIGFVCESRRFWIRLGNGVGSGCACLGYDLGSILFRILMIIDLVGYTCRWGFYTFLLLLFVC